MREESWGDLRLFICIMGVQFFFFFFGFCFQK